MAKQEENNPTQEQSDLTVCPNTRIQVSKKRAYEFPVPGGRAWWWYCQACYGWHITIEKTDHNECNRAHFPLSPVIL